MSSIYLPCQTNIVNDTFTIFTKLKKYILQYFTISIPRELREQTLFSQKNNPDK